jgi:hypothetical protein
LPPWSCVRESCFVFVSFWQSVLFFFLVVLGLELRAYTLSHSTSPFCEGFFWDRILQTICQGWLWTSVLLIAAFWIASITGVSHRCPGSTGVWTQGFTLGTWVLYLLSPSANPKRALSRQPTTHPWPLGMKSNKGKTAEGNVALNFDSDSVKSPSLLSVQPKWGTGLNTQKGQPCRSSDWAFFKKWRVLWY